MLFIYGTLRKGARNRYKIEPFITLWQSAAAQGSLFKHGKYPFLMTRGKTTVVGELVGLIDENETFKFLDKFEGPEYKREEIEVETANGEKKKAWVYLYRRDSPPDEAEYIDSGDWVQFEKRTLD